MYLNDVFDCSTTSWTSSSDPVTLTIISGSQYASFHTNDPETGTDINLGAVATTIGDSIGDYPLVEDSLRPDSAGEWIVVEAESNGLTSIDSIQAFPPPVVVTLTPPKISPGDTAAITVKQRNVDGTITDFPDYQRFEVGIDSGNAYGTILSSGDTAGYFASIPQPFQFIAADSINADSVMVGIRVGWRLSIASSTVPAEKGSGKKATVLYRASGEQNKSVNAIVKNPPVKSVSAMASKGTPNSVMFVDGDYGIGDVEIEKPTLKIVDHAPWSIWPDLPSGAITGEETSLPGYNHKRGFTISVTDAEGNPVKYAAVIINHNYQQGSGGHAHGATGASTMPKQPWQGTFYGQTLSGSSLALTTNANGIAIVDSLVASQISGTYLITAYLASDPSVMDTVNLNVQVPALVNFNDIIFPKGGKPFTLFQSSTGRANHPANDYCTPAMGDDLLLAIYDFNFWSASKEGGGVPMIVSLNDMSLPWGGIFDIDVDWQTPHILHRIGHSVDINNTGPFQVQDPDNPEDTTARVPTEKGRKLQKYMNDHGEGRQIPEPNSVHFEFDKEY
jgi:hypothetical protein